MDQNEIWLDNFQCGCLYHISSTSANRSEILTDRKGLSVIPVTLPPPRTAIHKPGARYLSTFPTDYSVIARG
jgi:hypothetical protein